MRKITGFLRQRRKGGVWHYVIYLNGKKVWRSTKTKDKKLAEQIAEKIHQRHQLLKNSQGKLLNLNQASVLEIKRLETDVSTSQAKRVEYALLNFRKWIGKDISLEKIDYDLVEEYQRHRLKKVSLSTVNKELDSIIRLLKNNGIYVERPKAKAGKIAENREFTSEEKQAFFEICEKYYSNYYCIFRTLYSTGARPAELVPSKRSNHTALKKSEVDVQNQIVIIRSAKVPVGRRGLVRRIQVSQEIVNMLVQQMELTPGDYVFSPVDICHIFDKILKKAYIQKTIKEDGIEKKLTAHSFRHTYASELAERCSFDQLALTKVLGHKKVSTTARYVHSKPPAVIIDISDFKGSSVAKSVAKNEEKEEAIL